MDGIKSEKELAALAVALGARNLAGWSHAEETLTRDVPTLTQDFVAAVRRRIAAGRDVLGEAFCDLRSPLERRPTGATYTPRPIIRAMLRWAAAFATPARVVDAGVGSARFLVAAGQHFPEAELVGIELDPLAAVLARAHLVARGLAHRGRIIVGDYRSVALPAVKGRTLFVGNPPYVRHHQIDTRWKVWLATAAARLNLDASQLAGLHVHFFLATLIKARPADYGAFITSAEWLDVNYGKLVRDLFLGGLGGRSIHVIEPTATPFPDAATTGAITCFQIGSQARSIRLRRVATLAALGRLDGGQTVRRERLEAAQRWTPLTRTGRKGPEGHVELGEICRVHRGQVTGANKVWIAASDVDLPASVLFPTVTKARELFAAGRVLADAAPLRRVIDLPVELDALSSEERKFVERFLKRAKALGADRGYIARARRAWWSVGLREPAPILSTYMARRPPTFVRNMASARHINIAHGLYPREPLPESSLAALADYLSNSISVTQGRTYAGGLTKFEPKEMERLLVPGPALLTQPSCA